MDKKTLYQKVYIDIVFCIDCTAASVIRFIRGDVLPKILESLNEPGLILESPYKLYKLRNVIDWRARVMGYRDFEFDEEYLMNDNPFVSTIEEVKCQLAGMDTIYGTGGDEPESTLDAIWYAAMRSDWRSNSHKFMFVFTDAPTKSVDEKTINDIICSDRDVDILAQELNVNHIKLFLFGPKDSVYDSLVKIPRSEIVQFEGDPFEFYWNLDLSSIVTHIKLIGPYSQS